MSKGKKIRLAIDVREMQLERVGVSVYANNVIPRIVDALSKTHEIILIGSRNENCPVKLNGSIKFLPIAPRPSDSIYFKTLWYLSLPRKLDQLRADLYFGPYLNVLPGYKGSTRVITTVHDAASLNTTGLVGSKFSRMLRKYLVLNSLRNADRIICISDYCKSEFSELYGESIRSKCEVIYHAVPDDFISVAQKRHNLDDFKKKYNISKPFLLAIGTVTPKKNYDRLIEAFERVADTNFDLVFIGSVGYQGKQIVERFKESKKANHIHYLGKASNEDLVAAMDQAEYFIFPSLYEGFGLPLLEAFHLGTPVLSSNATCLPEIAGDAALLFDPTNVHEMTSLISSLPLDESARKNLISCGKLRERQFSWEKSAEQHIRVFNAALGATSTK